MPHPFPTHSSILRSNRGVVRALAATLAAGALVVPASAQDERERVAIDVPSTAESFGDWLAVFATRTGLAFSRLVVDLTYEDVESLPGARGVLVTGLRVGVPVPYAEPRACTVEIDSLESTYSRLALFTGYLGEQTSTVSGLSMPLECLPPDARPFAQLARLDRIEVDTLDIDWTFDPVTARAALGLTVDAANLATIEARGELDYASVRFPLDGGGSPPSEEESLPGMERPGDQPIPVIEFGPVDLSIVDRGLVERLPPFLGMVGMPAEAIGPAVGGGLASQGVPIELATSVQEEVARFLNEGGRLAIALRPGELWYDEVERMSPPQIVAAFNPSVGNAPRPNLLSPELISKAGSSLIDPSDGDAFRIARAFLSGEGMPRNPARALEIVESAANTYDTDYAAEAREIAVEAMMAMNEDLDDAYVMAIEAGALGRPMGATLRRLEARLPPKTVVDAQRRVSEQWQTGTDGQAIVRSMGAALTEGDTGAILALARRSMAGDGVPRDFGAALFLGLLAEAGGELGASRIVERVEARAEAGEASREAWAPVIAEARDQATEVWIDGGLAAALAAREANGTSVPNAQ